MGIARESASKVKRHENWRFCNICAPAQAELEEAEAGVFGDLCVGARCVIRRARPVPGVSPSIRIVKCKKKIHKKFAESRERAAGRTHNRTTEKESLAPVQGAAPAHVVEPALVAAAARCSFGVGRRRPGRVPRRQRVQVLAREHAAREHVVPKEPLSARGAWVYKPAPAGGARRVRV